MIDPDMAETGGQNGGNIAPKTSQEKKDVKLNPIV
jgi:hypothetical protein